ncbi:MAG: hypothetical protein HC851_18735 [Acaryochloris sp. RU_4_1]|nr:hypothetical protein [Acaryochloris sp. RU_4_1]NJR57057.1 hypothetical protein [Acaryochloris sp. CRU_2_0]
MNSDYDPDLGISAWDALLDGGAPPSRVLNSELPIPRSWYPVLTVACLIIFAVAFGWAFWSDHRQERRWF